MSAYKTGREILTSLKRDDEVPATYHFPGSKVGEPKLLKFALWREMLLQYSLFMYHKNLLHDQEPIPIYDIGIGSHLEHAKSYLLITTLINPLEAGDVPW